MASNIDTKNTISDFKHFSALPYPRVGNVDYGASRAFIDSIALNNTYKQLVDNDLYVAQYLRQSV